MEYEYLLEIFNDFRALYKKTMRQADKDKQEALKKACVQIALAIEHMMEDINHG